MSDLREYDTVINGMATTLLLTADEAKKRGLTTTPAKAAAKPQGKASAAPRNKAAAPAGNKAPAASTPLGSGTLSGKSNSQAGNGDGSAA